MHSSPDHIANMYSSKYISAVSPPKDTELSPVFDIDISAFMQHFVIGK